MPSPMSLHDILRRAPSIDVAIRIMQRQGFTLRGQWYSREGERLTLGHVIALWKVYERTGRE